MELNVIGIDIGSVSASAVEIAPNKAIVKKASLIHKGDLITAIQKLLKEFNSGQISRVAVTDTTPAVVRAHKRYDDMVSLITAVKHFHPEYESVLLVGGERFGLIRFDENGNYLDFKSNTSCAAGTGSFLDQQVGRLNLGGIEELCKTAGGNRGKMPEIASRCAVFAKTDLIHAQQEGYSLPEICDGLCHGLAKNIADTVFSGKIPQKPVLILGGVARNRPVIKHLSALTGVPFIAGEHFNFYGAAGAALRLIEENPPESAASPLHLPEDIILSGRGKKSYHYPPLALKLSDYPDFSSEASYLFDFSREGLQGAVEVDIYETPPPPRNQEVYLGIDIGSTSTKAVILSTEKRVLAGFYTRTSGRPVNAVSGVFEAIEDAAEKFNIHFQFKGCGTTGSGRKFIGRILNGDICLDEITAHARAACELNPHVDTIIEIGGQDAKFTTLKNGMVTSSVMNNVCAAGTGSFIEEQALKLGCPISEYSEKAENTRAPMSSDRCTVFMERDLNHYLSEGFSINEVLASALHSVRENYLLKVAEESRIGDVIFFQGATAKNRALVAAFEQKLGKPILVSKYCHLTGALGTALTLMDEGVTQSRFRGTALWREKIPVNSEVCRLCNNRCKISVAHISGEKVAYGFLCGRDYDSKKFISTNRAGFDLIGERKKIFSVTPPEEYKHETVIGIPAALHLYEDLAFWQKFFSLLSIKTITSESFKPAVKSGKKVTGAEFCAPVTALHGHVAHLMEKADHIFLPYYIENKKRHKNGRRQYCYYTQFAPPVLSTSSIKETNRLLTPLLKYIYTSFHTKYQLYQMLKKITGNHISFLDVSAAYNKAGEYKNSACKRLKQVMAENFSPENNFSVVLLGRPYTVLSPSANNRIPEIFASMGVKTFYQDMLPPSENETTDLKPILGELHWNYAAQIIEAAEVTAKTRGLYPVFITSFKCAPDAFVLGTFKKIMESHGKPYLILELDEHDSSLGYETRIEAAIRSFRNNFHSRPDQKRVDYAPINTHIEKSVKHKTVVIPNWDHFTCTLLAENLKNEGIKAHTIEETPSTILKSLRFNTGQCLPVNTIAEGFIECMEKNALEPENTVLWLSHSEIACHIKLYPHYIKSCLKSYGNGMEKAGIYVGELSFIDISIRAAINAYFAYMFGGMLRKLVCRIRPYEKTKGVTDQTASRALEIFSEAFSGPMTKENAVIRVVEMFRQIETVKEKRIKVAIFGDIYVRDNDVMNQDLIRLIEENGGEAITTPYTDYAKMIAEQYFRKWFAEGKYMNVLSYRSLLAAMNTLEKRYFRHFDSILQEGDHRYTDNPEEILARYNLSPNNTGESMDNILKTHYIKKHHPDVTLFVQTSPAFCCASLVTEAMAERIEAVTGIPVISVTYDGTGGNKNRDIIPYLKYPRKKRNHKNKELAASDLLF